MAVAERVPNGAVIGVDRWSARDQSGNAPAVAARNARLEGVDARIRLATADMRALPFRGETFDLVVSSLAIHNIPGSSSRAKAVAEAYRVLKPGGRVALADIRRPVRYAKTLIGLGAIEVRHRRLGWRFWYGNPFAGTTLVLASKPK